MTNKELIKLAKKHIKDSGIHYNLPDSLRREVVLDGLIACFVSGYKEAEQNSKRIGT